MTDVQHTLDENRKALIEAAQEIGRLTNALRQEQVTAERLRRQLRGLGKEPCE